MWYFVHRIYKSFRYVVRKINKEIRKHVALKARGWNRYLRIGSKAYIKKFFGIPFQIKEIQKRKTILYFIL